MDLLLCYAFSSQPQFTPFLTSSNAFSISSDGFFVQRLTIMISIRLTANPTTNE